MANAKKDNTKAVKKETSHTGVLSYMKKEKVTPNQSSFYSDPLHRAFYEMYILA